MFLNLLISFTTCKHLICDAAGKYSVRLKTSFVVQWTLYPLVVIQQ